MWSRQDVSAALRILLCAVVSLAVVFVLEHASPNQRACVALAVVVALALWLCLRRMNLLPEARPAVRTGGRMLRLCAIALAGWWIFDYVHGLMPPESRLTYSAGAMIGYWALLIWMYRARTATARRIAGGLCRRCGYDLRATIERC